METMNSVPGVVIEEATYLLDRVPHVLNEGNDPQLLRISSQLVASVPRSCTLLMHQDPASGKVYLYVVGEHILFADASLDYNKPDTTDPTSR